MQDYINILKSEEWKSVSVSFHCETDKVMKIGDKINKINEQAYMNGYNWDAIFNAYLAKNNPQILAVAELDPEAGSYFCRFVLNPENEEKANKFAEIIVDLIENEEKLYAFVQTEGDKIEWD